MAKAAIAYEQSHGACTDYFEHNVLVALQEELKKL